MFLVASAKGCFTGFHFPNKKPYHSEGYDTYEKLEEGDEEHTWLFKPNDSWSSLSIWPFCFLGISCNWESLFIKNLGWTCDRPFVFLGAFGVFSWIQYSMLVLQFLLELGSIVPVYLIYIISFILFLPKCVQSLYALRAALRTAVFIFFWRNAWSWVRPSGGSPDPNVCSTGGDSTYVRGGFTVASAQFFQTRHHHSVIFSTWCVFRLQ